MPGARGTARALRALERKLARLKVQREAERARHARRIVALRRGANRRLATMLKEIAALRHHEARATALERLLAERDAALAAQTRQLTARGDPPSSPPSTPPRVDPVDRSL